MGMTGLYKMSIVLANKEGIISLVDIFHEEILFITWLFIP